MDYPETSLDLEQSRISLEALDAEAVVLCASLRLARNLRRDHDRIQLAQGLTRWQTLRALTIPQYLDQVMQECLLVGEIPAGATPRLVLDGLQERILWDRAVRSAANGEADEVLFDRDGLASAAAEANALMAAWNIRIPLAAAEQSEETRQFLRWREEFRRICDEAGWFDMARQFDWQIDCLRAGAGRLPRHLALAGFDRYNPQEARLAQALMQRGVAVFELEQGLPEAAHAGVVGLPDREAECRAAVAWARAQLEQDSSVRLGIVVPELAALRPTLAGLLDAALDPPALRPALAEMPRRYNFSLGLPLARQPCVAVALQLLACAAAGKLKQEDFSMLLRQPYWSAEVTEADGRARFDALIRASLAPAFAFERVLRFARKCAAKGLAIERLLTHLAAFKATLAAQPSRQVPSAWALAFGAILESVGWPGERSLSSHEYQAHRVFATVLDTLAGLDAVLGRVDIADARRRLAQICRERIFQPATVGDPPVQVMGLLEIADTPLDAIWVMGMNEHLWPPPARPNPLLPAELQRLARAPNASADVQREFANVIHRRLLRSAPQVCFSWARSEAARALRPSPLLGGMPELSGVDIAALATPAEHPADSAMESFEDAQAPPLAPGETVRGGAKLLQAQAICPAWAFYRYRLGAKALETPADGLDARARGNLLHAVLEHFWRGRGGAELQAMSAIERETAAGAAAEQTLDAFDAALEEPLSPRLRALERERLIRLVLEWLALEAQRTAAFRVVAREQEALVDIEGIAVRLRVDRIDELDDGRRVIIDYKTGGKVSQASWAAERIDEPQLPIYAAFLPTPAYAGVHEAISAAEGIAAVVFARVRLDECAFVGIAADGGLLPKVAGLAEAHKLFPTAQFPDWESLVGHWRARIAAIAREFREGNAAVSFADEEALAYCEVKPLLRLPEVRAQREQSEQAGQVQPEAGAA